ncbi:MAG: DUF2452 domain-containing protein [Flavobacteriales bacterium]|nr:DUF2452 domain-containing protein [Flavobacteriales bacterium]
MKKYTHFSRADIENMDKLERVQFINTVNGFKSANLIGTRDKAGQSNLAIFNSVIHLGSNPALLGFITRPVTIDRHTHANILETGLYTINHVHISMTERAHYTSAKFDKAISEFYSCGLTEEYLEDFTIPYVLESRVKMGMKLEEVIDIEVNGTMMVIGSVQHIYTSKEFIDQDGSLLLDKAGTVAISGLDSYFKTQLESKYPYAKVEEKPVFLKDESRSDQVVYDEGSGNYNASLLPYATDQGAPSIVPSDLTMWKKTGASKISHHLKARYEEIKAQFDEMKSLYSWNEMVYQAKFSFEPVLGETYHLYRDAKEELFLSMIPPNSWKREHLGSFRLNADQIWERLDV